MVQDSSSTDSLVMDTICASPGAIMILFSWYGSGEDAVAVSVALKLLHLR